MDSTGLRHRLMAILAADAAGYSRLMAADEGATVAALDAAREVFRQHTDHQLGRVVDTAGDSVLAVFDTAYGAVNAALAIQRQLAAEDVDSSEGRRMQFRIGIHLGDVIEKPDGSVYGNGVNIAARLQALAAPGAISVSEAVRSTLGERPGRSFDDQGQHCVKNIDEPVHAYQLSIVSVEPRPVARRLALPETAAASVPVAAAASLKETMKPWRVAVIATMVFAIGLLGWLLWTFTTATSSEGRRPGSALIPMSLVIAPIASPSGEAIGASFADALRHDLVTGIGAVERNITVLSLASDTEFGSAINLRESARRVGARYVVEGDARRTGEGHVVNLRLIDTEFGIQAWSTRKTLKDADSSIERSIAYRQLIRQLAASVAESETNRLLAQPLDRLTASELELRGWAVLDQKGYTLANAVEARNLFERALQLNPNLVDALLSQAVLLDFLYGVDPNPDHDQIVREMDELTTRALTLDSQNPRVWDLRMMSLVYLGRWAAAAEAIDRAIHLDPYRGAFLTDKAWLRIVTGRPHDALELIDSALELKPTNVFYEMRMACQAHLLLGHADQAVKTCEKATGLAPNHWIAHLFLIAAYANVGDMAKAAAAKRAVQQVLPGYTIAKLRAYRYSEHPEYLKLVEAYWYAGLRKAGVPEE